MRESAIYTKKKRERSITPGLRIIGSGLLDGERESQKLDGTTEVMQMNLAYLLRTGGFEISEEHLVEEISKRRDSEDVMDVQIARVMGLHEKWGLDRRFISRSIYAHRFENGTIIEHTLLSYGGFVSRTYYVVDGNNFRAFAQRNFRRQSD